MKNEKLIKGLKKVIKKLKPFNDQILNMDDFDTCALAISKLWHYEKGNTVEPNQQKTAKKLFGIKTLDDVFVYDFGCSGFKPSPNLTKDELKVLKLFRWDQYDIKIKKWRKNAKKVLKELENANEM